MKAVLLPTLFLLVTGAQPSWAVPTLSGAQFNCAYKPQANGDWEPRGLVQAYTGGDGLHLQFSGSGMDSIQTTNTDSEFRVEGRCPGSITLTDNKPFKIRDFTFIINFAEIGANEGQIELHAKGWAFVTGTDQKDSFDKVWTVPKNVLDRYNNASDSQKAQLNPFSTKQESQTVCGQQLTLRFDDLRGVAIRNQTSNVDQRQPTEIDLAELLVKLDPC